MHATYDLLDMYDCSRPTYINSRGPRRSRRSLVIRKERLKNNMHVYSEYNIYKMPLTCTTDHIENDNVILNASSITLARIVLSKSFILLTPKDLCQGKVDPSL